MTIILAIAAATAPAITMTPTSKWVVDGEENLCVLERQYTGAGKTMTLILQPLLDLDTMEVTVVSDDRSSIQHSGVARVALAPGNDRTYSGKYFSVLVPAKKLRFTRLTIDRALLPALHDGDRLTIEAKPISAIFPIVRPDQARAYLAQCQRSLEKAWGVDPDAKAAVAVPPRANAGAYFTSKDYPSEAYSAGIYGRVVALLSIAIDGHVSQCRVVSSAGKLLNDGTCKVAMRIHFRPALDNTGQPIASTYLLPVSWMLPGV